jgi:hypothetical protein
VTTFLVVGPHSLSDAEFRRALAGSSVWRRVERLDYTPSALVWLDLHDPRMGRQDAAVEHALELYRYVAE